MMVPNLISTGSGSGLPGPRGPRGYSTYEIAVEQGFVGTEAEWLLAQVGPEGPAGPKGEAGERGPAGEKGDKGDAGTGLTNRGSFALGSTYNPSDYVFAAGASAASSMFISQASDAFVAASQPKDDPANWVEFSAPAGADGVDGTDGSDGTNGLDGKSVELQKTSTAIQWRQAPEGSWADLVFLADLKGADGDDGTDGANGTNGIDGRSVELQKTSTAIQWRQTGGTFADLVPLAEISGSNGANGADGSNGRDGIDGAQYVTSSMSSVTLPSTVTAIRVGGYYTPGDGGAALYTVVGTQPTHAGKFQTADARWWELQSAGEVDAAVFGAKPEAGFDNAPRFNNATSYLVAKNGGGVLNIGAGTFQIAGVVWIKSRVTYRGKGRRLTWIQRLDGYLGDLLKTTDFDTIWSGDTAGGPNRFTLESFSVHGRKDAAANASATGWNIRIYGRAYKIEDLDSEYCCNGGFYSRWGSVSAAWDNDTTDSVMEAYIDSFYVQFCREGAVFDGPHDSQIGSIIVAMMRHNREAVADTSLLTIGSRASGSQFGLVHVWGARAEFCVTNYAQAISITDLLVDDTREGGGLFRQLGSDCYIRGRGLQFGDEAITGLVIGSTSIQAARNRIEMLITNTPSTVINFVNDGGNDISITATEWFSTSNFIGTRHATTTLQYTARGTGANANDVFWQLGAMTVNKQTVQLAGRSGTPNDVTWVNGLMYFDTALQRLRIYRNGSWANVAMET